jgi:hypothetical protein
MAHLSEVFQPERILQKINRLTSQSVLAESFCLVNRQKQTILGYLKKIGPCSSKSANKATAAVKSFDSGCKSCREHVSARTHRFCQFFRGSCEQRCRLKRLCQKN